MRTLSQIMFGLAALLLIASFTLWISGVWGDVRAIWTGWITAGASIAALFAGAICASRQP